MAATASSSSTSGGKAKEPPGKKAKRPKKKSSKGFTVTKTAAAVSSRTSTCTSSSSSSTSLQSTTRSTCTSSSRGPLPTLILDTGGWTVKHGTLPAVLPDRTLRTATARARATATATPRNSPNATARPRHQLTVLAADEINSISNQGQLEFTRPLERGYTTDPAAQLRVWKRVCDLEGIDARPADPADASELLSSCGVLASAVSGGGGSKRKNLGAGGGGGGARVLTPPPSQYASANCRLVLLTQPFTPRSIRDRVDEVCFRALGFAVVGKMLVQCAAAARYLDRLMASVKPPLVSGDTGDTDGPATVQQQSYQTDSVTDDGTRCCLVVDSGFSLTHVVPTFECRAVKSGIRRLNVGGRMITNLLKEWVSYRQWNLMDEFPIVNEAKEALCYIVPSSNDYDEQMDRARRTRLGYRDFDREFVLPDFADTFEGSVRLAAGLRKKKDHEERDRERKQRRELKKKMKRKEEEKQKEDAAAKGKGKDMETEEVGESNGEKDEGGKAENDDNVDSDDETDAQRIRRIQRQKEEERRRRALEEESRQALTLSVERFAAPEVLFRPDDIGLDQGGVAETIVQAVEACPSFLRAAMYRNVLLTGGNAMMPGFARRLEKELRSLTPSQYDVRVCLPDDPVTYAWKGARHIAGEVAKASSTNIDSSDSAVPVQAFRECFVDRVEWETATRSVNLGQEHANVWAKAENARDGMVVL